MADVFTNSDATATTSRTLLYGPVAAATTSIVFSGVLANIDTTNRTLHKITLEKYNGSTYVTVFREVPVDFGSSSKIPKIVLKTGESLYITADAASAIQASISILERS